MKKLSYIALITCGSLLVIPTVQVTKTTEHSQYVAAEEVSTESNTTQPASKYTGLPGKIDNIAQQITVRIDSKNNGNGSGVIVAHEGDTYYVATAGHVVKNQDNYTIVTPDGQSYPVENSTIKTSEGVDLAVVQFESQQAYTVATLGKYDLSYNTDEVVFVSGFPGKRVDTKVQPSRLLTAGIMFKNVAELISKDFYSFTSGNGLIYTNLSFPGMSGGAVLDSQGRLVGINTGAEDEVVVSKAGNVDEISLGWSLGIPIDTLIRLAKTAKINLERFKQETSQPSELEQADFDSIKEQMFDVKVPSSNATDRDWVNYGNQLWRTFQADKAIAAFERAIELNPNSHYAYYDLGVAAFFYTGQPQKNKARDAFEQVTKLAPDFFPAWQKMGLVLLELKQYPEAINALDHAIQLQPGDFISYYQRGAIYAEFLKDYEAAIADHNKAIEINPNFADAYSSRGYAYIGLENYEAALADYNKALEINPGGAYVYYNRGIAYRQLENSEAALADFNKALEINPNYAEAYVIRGNVYEELENSEAALADFNKALEINPNLAAAYNNRGNAYKELENSEAAIADYNKALEINPNLALVYSNRGYVYHKQQKFNRALSDYSKALSLENNDFVANFMVTMNIGLVKYELGSIKEAKKQFQLAVNIDNKSAEAQLAFAVALYSLGESEKAITMAEKALSIDKQFADPEFLRENLWGDKLIVDTTKLLFQPQIQELLARF